MWLALMVVAAQLTLTEIKVLGPDFGTQNNGGNGYHALLPVWKKQCTAPGQYRVLIPWIVVFVVMNLSKLRYRITGERKQVNLWGFYQVAKGILVWVMLYTCYLFFGLPVTMFLCAVTMLHFQYDYWDIYVEAICLLLALTGNLPLALVAAVIGGLSRPTTALVGPIFGFVTGEWLWAGVVLAVNAAVQALVIWYQGPAKRALTVKQLIVANLHWMYSMKRRKKWIPYLMWHSFWIVLCSVTMILFHDKLPHPLAVTAWVPPVICLAASTMGVIWEPRAMTSAAIWVGAALCS